MLSVHPATPERWHDVERLFGAHGACGGCWCMWFRLPRAEYEAGRGEQNRRALKSLVEGGCPPGVIGYAGDTPIGWCAVAPRAEYRRLAMSRTMRSSGDTAAWLIMCLYIAPAHRRNGHSATMIRAACAFAQGAGATRVEGYALRPKRADMPPMFASQGTLSAYLAAGFAAVTEPSDGRVLVRWEAPPR